MHDWMISKKRYWGLALPIYDCQACGTVDVVGGRDELQRAGRRGLGGVRGPHAASAVRRRGEDRLLRPAASRSSGSRTSATRGSTRGSCRSRRSTSARTRSTGRSGTRPTSSPRASPASSATGSTRCSRWARSSGASRRSRRSSATPSSSARTAGRCTRAGATRSTSTRRPSGWASTSCAGCSRPPGRRRTSGSAGTPPTTRGASCSSSGTSTRSSSAYARLGRLDAGSRRAAAGRAVADGSLDPVAGGGAGRGGRRPPGRLRRPRRDAAGSRRSSTTSRPGTSACRGSGSRRNEDGADRDAAFATLHEALVTAARVIAPLLPFLAESIYGNLVAVVEPDAPDSVHLTRWPADELAGAARSAPRGGDGRRPARPSSWPGRCAERPGSRSASRSPGSGSRCPAATCRSATRSSS